MKLIKLYSSPTAYVLETESLYSNGDIVEYTTRHDKVIELQIYKFVINKNSKNYYSYVRLDGKNRKSVLQGKIEKRLNWAESNMRTSDSYCQAANEGKDFLILGEPIKVGHHSEKKHRALLDRNDRRMGKCVEHLKQAKHHENTASNINLQIKKELPIDTPECLLYIQYALKQARATHRYLKENKGAREHSYSLTYANKKVKDLTTRLNKAKLLWELQPSNGV